MNKVIKQLLDDGKITQDKYDILFEDKSSWFTTDANDKQDWSQSYDRQGKFKKTLIDVISLQLNDKVYDLTYIIFPPFSTYDYFVDSKIDKVIIFNESKFNGDTLFSGKFNNMASFNNVKFNGKSNFDKIEFNGDAWFDNAEFNNDVLFDDVKFSDLAWFNEAKFNGTTSFDGTKFGGEALFNDTIFNKITGFYKTTFENEVIFKSCFFEEVAFNNVDFKNVAIFKQSEFKNDARFRGITFNEWASFKKIFVENILDFTYSRTKDFIDFSNSEIHCINLEHTRFDSAGFLNLVGIKANKEKITISKGNFANKESARIIKAHFEKAGNITEANKYFVIEQEKYIDDLWSDEKYEDKRITKLIPLYLNKWVSNFGTNWVRSILFLLLFGIAFQSIFNYIKCESNATFDMGLMLAFIGTSLSYHLTYIETRLKMKNEILVVLALFLYLLILYLLIGINNLNDIVKLLNPINAFKDKDDIFQGYETFGAFVRIVSATIIYQIIVSFRQFTRRS